MTFNELQRHIGRLEEKIEINKVLLQNKDREIAELHHINSNVHDDLAEHKAVLRKVEMEKQLLLQDLGRLHHEIDAKNTALQKLQDDLVKAQKTIKVQSDQISGANGVKEPKPQITPQRFGPPAGLFSQVYSQPPPAYNASASRFPQPAPVVPQTAPTLRRQSSNYPTIQPTFSTIRPSAGNPNRPAITADPSFDPFQTQQGVQPQQGVLVRQSQNQNHNHDQASTYNLIAEFTPFFHATEIWATNYASVPDQHRDQFISDNLRNALALAVDPRSALGLMSSSKTRPLLIARVINQVIVDYVFRPILLRGFSPIFDNKISSFRGQLMGNIPSSVRRALLLACAETIIEMTQADGFDYWIDRSISPKVHDMWHMLQPIFALGTPRDPAWNDLNRIWREATRIGILMLSKPCIYTLDFPPMGPNSYFNPSNMCNRDDAFPQKPQALGSMAVSVRLAVTPIVTETDFMKDAIEAKCLHQAMVLLSW